MPGARCTRGLVRKMHKEMRTRAYRFSGSTPAFPAEVERCIQMHIFFG